MHHYHREWLVKDRVPVLTRMLVRECGISELTAQLLVNRGIYTAAEARVFLDGDLNDLWSPYLLRDMDQAVARIRAALVAGERMLIYGDYDVDGMTATALLVKTLRFLGGQAGYHVPGRSDGYGLHAPVLERAAAGGVRLVITVDCGVTALAEVERARELGLDVIVTDHHEPQDSLPAALVINPRRLDCSYPFKHLAGVGVALKLAQALLDGELPPEFLGLACLGTVADVMPLRGENRLLVRHGLPLLAENPGIVAVATKSRLDCPGIRDVAFGIAPLINAAGRVGRAELGVELLLAGGPDEARAAALELGALNEERKYLEEKVSAEVFAELGRWSELPPVVVVAGEGWNPGVVGIVASRLAGRLDRPVALIAVEGEEGRGSARSNASFDLVRALGACRELLLRFGGHRQAAGFSLSAGLIPRFAAALNEYAQALPTRETEPAVMIDAVVGLGDLTLPLLREIERLEPWGAGNEPPLLAAGGVQMARCREVGRNGEHLKLDFHQGRVLIGGIGFNLAGVRAEMEDCPQLDLVFEPLLNRWNGRETPEIKVVDWKPSGPVLSETAAAAASAEEEPLANGSVNCTPPPFFCRAWREKPEELEGESRLRRVYDVRHRPFWGSASRRFLGGGDRTLVVVPHPEMIPETASVMQLVYPDCRERLDWLVPGSGNGERAAVLERFRSGAGEILITAGPPDESLPPARTLVLGLLYDWSDWRAMACCGEELVLAFCAHDHERNCGHLRGLAPDRKCLLDLYRLLRVTGPGAFDRDVAVQELQRRGYHYVSDVTVEVGLAVLGELGLVTPGRTGGGLELIQPTGERKPLSQSPTFCRMHNIKRSARQCQKFFLEAPRPDLARFFGCDIISLGDEHGH